MDLISMPLRQHLKTHRLCLLFRQKKRDHVRFLLKHRVDVRKKDHLGWQAIHFAVARSQLAMFEDFLKYDVDWRTTIKMRVGDRLFTNIEIEDHRRCKPIHRAVIKGNTGVVEILLKHSCTLPRDAFGFTPELYALKYGYTTIVEMLREYQSKQGTLLSCIRTGAIYLDFAWNILSFHLHKIQGAAQHFPRSSFFSETIYVTKLTLTWIL